jgi:hypothetical protein
MCPPLHDRDKGKVTIKEGRKNRLHTAVGNYSRLVSGGDDQEKKRKGKNKRQRPQRKKDGYETNEQREVSG